MQLISHGAAETVTGSCHLLELSSHFKLLIDCGMFQGEKASHNAEPFGFNPKEVKLLLITHAHLDHVGRIPKLVKEGFKGRIIATCATLALAKVVLLDSAKLMLEDYRTQLKKAQRCGKEHLVPLPLYTKEDVLAVFDLDVQYARYDKPVKLTQRLTATFRNASHILGSATITLEIGEKPHRHTLVFSGDLGNRFDPVLPPPEPVFYADALFIESTYGDRNHKNINASIEEFKQTVIETLRRRGNIIIPSFAIERTQEVLCILKTLQQKNQLPVCEIFVDSPMAIQATRIYDHYHKDLSHQCQAFAAQGGVFDMPNLHFTQSVKASQKINAIESGAIIIAGSGMCTGGRILHHFKHRLWNKHNTVVFVGYQARGTLGRELVEGAKWVKIYHEQIAVKAKIVSINGFSAHADQSELIHWIHQFKKLKRLFLIHGEPDKQAIFQKSIQHQLHKHAEIVKLNTPITLSPPHSNSHNTIHRTAPKS